VVKINLAWLYAITKYGYPPPMSDVFKALNDAKRLGFKYIELEVYGERNLRDFEANKDKLREVLGSLGLEVVNLAGIFPEIVSLKPSVRNKGIELMRRVADLATYFDSELIQTDTFYPPIKFVGEPPYKSAITFGRKYRAIVEEGFLWTEFWSNLVDSMRKIAVIAEDRGLRFAIEPRIGETISNSDAMLRLMEAVNVDCFGAVLDTGHLHAAKELLALSVEKLGNKIFYVHISDNDGRDNYHWAPGRGTIDWEGVFRGLKRHKFNGPIAIDVGGPDLLEHLDEEVMRAKRFVENMIKKYNF